MLALRPPGRPAIALGLVFASVLLGFRFRARLGTIAMRLHPRQTVEERIARLGPSSRERLRESFERNLVPYPPEKLVLVALKSERELRVYSRHEGSTRLIVNYPILASSGGPGPKLREGDRQVPEGVYAIEALNPNSRFHLALRLNYPNAFDLERAKEEGRTSLGGDIMIHGGQASIGCLAIGDPSIEELFVLVSDVGLTNVRVVMAPHDLQARPAPPTPGTPWSRKLYGALEEEFAALGN